MIKKRHFRLAIIVLGTCCLLLLVGINQSFPVQALQFNQLHTSSIRRSNSLHGDGVSHRGGPHNSRQRGSGKAIPAISSIANEGETAADEGSGDPRFEKNTDNGTARNLDFSDGAMLRPIGSNQDWRLIDFPSSNFGASNTSDLEGGSFVPCSNCKKQQSSPADLGLILIGLAPNDEGGSTLNEPQPDPACVYICDPNLPAQVVPPDPIPLGTSMPLTPAQVALPEPESILLFFPLALIFSLPRRQRSKCIS